MFGLTVVPVFDEEPLKLKEYIRETGIQKYNSPVMQMGMLTYILCEGLEYNLGHALKIVNMPFLSKKESGYFSGTPDINYHHGHSCYKCIFFDDGKCSLVKGKLKKVDSCNVWSRDGILDLRFIEGSKIDLSKERLTPEDAGYIEDEIDNIDDIEDQIVACKSCIWFGGKGCYPVKKEIKWYGCCNVFNIEGEKDKNKKYDYLSGADITLRLGDKVLSSDDPSNVVVSPV
jgi:hypothetical protein